MSGLNCPSLLPAKKAALLLFFYIFAVTLLFAARVQAQEGRESAEINLSRAVLLYDEKKYDEATQLLLKANQQDPRNTNVIYYLALSLSQQGKHAEAEAYLRKGLEVQPKNANLQYLLAYTLRAQGKTAESRQVAEVIQLDPASPLVGPSRDLLTAMRTPRRGDSPFWLELTARGQYDSNVTLEPNHSGAGHLPSLGPSESWGNLVSLSTEYAFLRSANWQAAGRYDFLQTINYHNHKFDFNENIIGGRVTYNDILPGGQRYFLTGRGFYDNLLQGGKQYLARPTGVFDTYFYWDGNGSNRTQLLYQLQGSNYQTGRRDENRDGLNHRVGLVHYIFFDHQRYGINLGYNFDYEDAVGANWNYSGHRAVAGFLLTLPWEIKATSNFEFHHRHYIGVNSIYFKRRVDDEFTVLSGLAKDITPNLTASFEYLWNSDSSTIAVYSYKRQVYSLGLTWRYY
jgi:tetratricopeptide (TPR) repeat protein